MLRDWNEPYPIYVDRKLAFVTQTCSQLISAHHGGAGGPRTLIALRRPIGGKVYVRRSAVALRTLSVILSRWHVYSDSGVNRAIR